MEILKFRVNGSSEWHEITAIRGEKGATGATGNDGKTPVRGTDYWTNEDVAAIESHCNSYIDSQLGTINEQLASLTEVK